MNVKVYLLNCFLLLIPIFLWNIFLIDFLPKPFTPELFDQGIPPIISFSENLLRGIVFILPLFMKFELNSKRQKLGFGLYLKGVMIYFSSWLALILYPNSSWSSSVFGITAPAYTTVIWLIGIGLIGQHSYLKFSFISLVYIISALIFVAVHTIHAYLAFQHI